MEILKSINELRIAEKIKQAIESGRLIPKGKELSNVKRELREECGLISLNILNNTNNGVMQIITKSKLHSYVYSYNAITNEISLIGGIRNNVVIN